MTWGIGIMYCVAALFAVIGIGLFVGLARTHKERKVYAYRMMGVMALSLGVVLAMSATAMWRWNLAA